MIQLYRKRYIMSNPPLSTSIEQGNNLVLFMIQFCMQDFNWNKSAGLLLKTEMRRNDMTSEKLAKRLNKIGVDTTADSIRQKISRGTLKTSLLLQCLYVMQVDSLDIGHLFPKLRSD